MGCGASKGEATPNATSRKQSTTANSPPIVEILPPRSADGEETGQRRRSMSFSVSAARSTHVLRQAIQSKSFMREPAVCKYCDQKDADELLQCEICSDIVICENCLFMGDNADHDDTHAMQRYRVPVFMDFAASVTDVKSPDGKEGALLPQHSLLNQSCPCCQGSIFDDQDCFRCTTCETYIICESCGENNKDNHNRTHIFEKLNRKEKVNQVKCTASLKIIKSESKKQINDYIVVKLIGRGSFGKVKLIQHVQTHELYALKILNKSLLRKNDPAMDGILTEVAIMKVLDHPNVVKLFEVIDDHESEKLYLVMELLEGPIWSDGKIEEKELIHYGRQILEGLIYLHSQVIYHRDVKPANILLGKDGIVKLTDFGVSKSGVGKLMGSHGTIPFLCPEILESKEVSGAYVDAWAFGITLFMMAFGKLPYKETAINANLCKEIVERNISIPTNCSPYLKDVLEQLLHPDISQRTDVVSIASHSYFNFDTGVLRSMNEVRRMKVTEEMRNTAVRKIRRISESQSSQPPPEVFDDSPGSSTKIGAKMEISCNCSDNIEEVMEQYKRSKNKKLKIIGLFMQQIPEAICSAAGDANILILEDNVLMDSSISVDGFKHLQHLKINNNGLKSVPSTIFKLLALQSLTLSANEISELPAEIKNLHSLSDLDISKNKFTEIPKVIADMKGLSHLVLSENPIDQLSPVLKKCKKMSIVMDNAPEALNLWNQKYVKQCKNVCILWNHIFPVEVFPNIFVGSKASEKSDRVRAALKIKHVLRSTRELTEYSAFSASPNHYDVEEKIVEALSEEVLFDVGDYMERCCEMNKPVLVAFDEPDDISVAVVGYFIATKSAIPFDEAISNIRDARGGIV